MEKKLISFKDVKVGEIFLIDNPLFEEDVTVCASIMKVNKYPISEKNGRKLRMVDDSSNGRTKPEYADEVGDKGDEMINEYTFLSSNVGDYMFKEDDIPVWNIRQIDEEHPKYDKKLVKEGIGFHEMFSFFDKFFDKII